MGGHGTWAMALAQPNRFAAIAPICGDAHEGITLFHILRVKWGWRREGVSRDLV